MQGTDAPWQISQDRLKNPGLPSTPSSTVRKRRPDPSSHGVVLATWDSGPGLSWTPACFPCWLCHHSPPRSPDWPTPGTLLPSLLWLCTHSCPSPRRGGYDAQNWYGAIKNVLFEAVLHPRYSMKSTLVPSCLLWEWHSLWILPCDPGHCLFYDLRCSQVGNTTLRFFFLINNSLDKAAEQVAHQLDMTGSPVN